MLKNVWTYNIRDSFPNLYISRLSIDPKRNQAIITTRDNESGRKNAVIAVNLESGKLVWTHVLNRKKTEVFEICLDEASATVLVGYNGDSDSFHHKSLYSLSLADSSVLWTYCFESKDPDLASSEEIEGLYGVVDGVLVGRNVEGNLTGIDVKTGRRVWELPKSYVNIGGRTFLPLGEVVLLQTRKRKLGWVDYKTGGVSHEIELKFNAHGNGFIDGIWSDDSDEFLVSVYDSKTDFNRPGHPRTLWAYSMVYAVDKYDHRSELVARVNGRVDSVSVTFANSYISTKNRCFIPSGSGGTSTLLGKYAVLSAYEDGILLCQNSTERFEKRYTLSLRNQDGILRWESFGDYELLLSYGAFLFVRERVKQRGRQEKENLLVLTRSAKLLAQLEMYDIRKIIPLITDDQNTERIEFLVLRDRDLVRLSL